MLKRAWDWLICAEIEIEMRAGIVYFFEVPILPLLDIRVRLLDLRDGHHR